MPRLLALVLLLLTAAGDDLSGLVADLNNDNVDRRVAALDKLRSRKDPKVVPLLVEAIEGFGQYGRYYGVLVLDSSPPRSTPGAWVISVPILRPGCRSGWV